MLIIEDTAFADMTVNEPEKKNEKKINKLSSDGQERVNTLLDIGYPVMGWHPIQGQGGGGKGLVTVLVTLSYRKLINIGPCGPTMASSTY